MTTRTMAAVAFSTGRVRRHEHPLAVANRANWAAFRAMLARAASRRRLARSIAHLDDRLLADAGLTAEQRGQGDNLICYFAMASEMLTSLNARRG